METKRIGDFETEIDIVDQAKFARLYSGQYFLVASGIDLEKQAQDLYCTVQVQAGEVGRFKVDEKNLVHIIEFPDKRAKLKIGRAPNCEIMVPSEYADVSAGHAFLKAEDGGMCVMDVSRNGTFLNGRQIPAMTNVRVTDSSTIKLAKSYQIGVYEPGTFYVLLKKFFE